MICCIQASLSAFLKCLHLFCIQFSQTAVAEAPGSSGMLTWLFKSPNAAHRCGTNLLRLNDCAP